MPTISALIRQPATLPEPDTDQGETESVDNGEGGGRTDSRPATRPRRRKPTTATEKTNKRGLYLMDSTWEKLQLEAIRKRTNVSAIAGELLERNLPKLRIERDA